jgi:hypothetical protein
MHWACFLAALRASDQRCAKTITDAAQSRLPRRLNRRARNKGETMRLRRILTMTAPLLLYGAAKALAATSGLPADGPVTIFTNFISTDVAYGLVGVGFAAVAGHCVMGRDFGMTLHHGVGAMVGGGLCSQIQPAAAALGLSAGALIHLVH